MMKILASFLRAHLAGIGNRPPTLLGFSKILLWAPDCPFMLATALMVWWKINSSHLNF